jgi:hypothetical protein
MSNSVHIPIQSQIPMDEIELTDGNDASLKNSDPNSPSKPPSKNIFKKAVKGAKKGAVKTGTAVVSVWEDFSNFIKKGNVIDLAVSLSSFPLSLPLSPPLSFLSSFSLFSLTSFSFLLDFFLSSLLLLSLSLLYYSTTPSLFLSMFSLFRNISYFIFHEFRSVLLSEQHSQTL